MGVSVGRDIKALGRSISGGRSGAYEEEVAKAVEEALRGWRTPRSSAPTRSLP